MIGAKFILLIIGLQFGTFSVPKPSFNFNNFIKTDHNIYFQKFEVSNIQYKIFLNDISEEERLKHSPDSSLFPSGYEFYFIHPSFNNFPVTAISQESAKAYCIWLNSKIGVNSSGKKIRFRLPNKEEWKRAARAGDTTKVFSAEMIEKNCNPTLSAKYRSFSQRQELLTNSDSAIIWDSYREFTSENMSYKPNSKGLYDMGGNVSEWLDEEGLSFGGNWASVAYYLRIDAPEELARNKSASSKIGFRIIMEEME